MPSEGSESKASSAVATFLSAAAAARLYLVCVSADTVFLAALLLPFLNFIPVIRGFSSRQASQHVAHDTSAVSSAARVTEARVSRSMWTDDGVWCN